MKVNWKRFVIDFVALLVVTETAILMCGCSAAWLTAVSGLLPALAAAVDAIVAFVKNLEDKTVPSSFVTAVQKIQADIAAEITNIQTAIAAAKGAASAGLIAQIQAVMQSILTNIQSILNNTGITDTDTVTKLEQFVALGVAAVQAILGLIPLVLSRLQTDRTAKQLEADDRMASAAINTSKKTLQETYKVIIADHTDNSDVNAALDALPRSL